MSKIEYDTMIKTGRMIEGAGGFTFVATGVFAEFDVPAKSLIQGGQPNWFKAVGTGAHPSQVQKVYRQGGQLLPEVQNISPILKTK